MKCSIDSHATHTKAIQSSTKPFRYLTAIGTATTHLAASRVLVGHVDPAPFFSDVERAPSSKRLGYAVMAKNYSHLDLSNTRFLDALVQHEPLWAGLVAKMAPVAGLDVAKCADVNYACINTAVSSDMPLQNNVFGALFLDGP